MTVCKLAAIVKKPEENDEFLLVKQKPPPKFGDDEYDSYVDTDLYDLPSSQIRFKEGEHSSPVSVDTENVLSPWKLNLEKLDINSSIWKILEELGLRASDVVTWTFVKYVKEAEFGPGSPEDTLFVSGRLVSEDIDLQGTYKWLSIQSCSDWFLDRIPGKDRVGPLAFISIADDSKPRGMLTIPGSMCLQEFPPGAILVPMGSRTGKPFHTTNLVVIAPPNLHDLSGDGNCVAYGDALIVDPGCKSQFHDELKDIITALPRKLVVFVTHHHRDHVDGLSVIQRSNPNAIIVAHENTMNRIKKDWSLRSVLVSGDEQICIGGELFRPISAPGHTDGHMALLDIRTQTLIVGDHCVGQGSAVLDASSGGNMADYFHTTYKFLDLSPNFLIPMHGRVNLWPKYMLCMYLRNRRNREESVVKAIQNGAKSLYDIVLFVYTDIDPILLSLASSNVKLHVEHLALHHKLPKEFSLQKFQRTCGIHFLACLIVRYVVWRALPTNRQWRPSFLLLTVVGFALIWSIFKVI